MPSLDSSYTVDDGVSPARLIAWTKGCSFGELLVLYSPAQLPLGNVECSTDILGTHQVIGADSLLCMPVKHFEACVFYWHELCR